jgi:hypothetical protein
MAINYSRWSSNIPTFKGPPKFTQVWDFGFENKPSGNPVPESQAGSSRNTTRNRQ